MQTSESQANCSWGEGHSLMQACVCVVAGAALQLSMAVPPAFVLSANLGDESLECIQSRAGLAHPLWSPPLWVFPTTFHSFQMKEVVCPPPPPAHDIYHPNENWRNDRHFAEKVIKTHLTFPLIWVLIPAVLDGGWWGKRFKLLGTDTCLSSPSILEVPVTHSFSHFAQMEFSNSALKKAPGFHPLTSWRTWEALIEDERRQYSRHIGAWSLETAFLTVRK